MGTMVLESKDERRGVFNRYSFYPDPCFASGRNQNRDETGTARTKRARAGTKRSPHGTKRATDASITGSHRGREARRGAAGRGEKCVSGD
jgi:hypothetical protein